MIFNFFSVPKKVGFFLAWFGFLFPFSTGAVESNDHLDVSPDGRFLAFDGGERGAKDIYLLDLETGICRILVALDSDDAAPTWSPNGKKVAFTATSGDNREIYLATKDGQKFVPVADPKGVLSPISWTPEGNGIVFAQGAGDNEINLLSLDFETREPRVLFAGEGSERHPFWSEALGLYFYSGGVSGAMEIFSFDPKTGESKQITDDGAKKYVPRVSPDGKKLVYGTLFEEKFDLFVYDFTGKITNITNHPAHDLFGTWDPSGRILYFESTRDRGDLDGKNGYDLYALVLETGETTRLTTPETCK